MFTMNSYAGTLSFTTDPNPTSGVSKRKIVGTALLVASTPNDNPDPRVTITTSTETNGASLIESIYVSVSTLKKNSLDPISFAEALLNSNANLLCVSIKDHTCTIFILSFLEKSN